MSRFHRSLMRTGAAGLALGVTSALAAGGAQPAGAITPPVIAAPHSVSPPVHVQIKPTSPMCLVGAALLYPLFLGRVMFTNPVELPSAAPGYWTGGERAGNSSGHGDRYPGYLSSCGVGGGDGAGR